ncbi:MAG: hypothetical protein KC501_22710 [Myxococcales bacterium]|nr:hypothetical protein [Myxococcales bacterium]
MKAPRRRWALVAAMATALAVAPRPAAAAPEVLRDPEARAHFEQAQRDFDQQDYASAIPELKAAYALEPNPMLLYAWGQAERLAGSCARAVELYRRFIDTNPAPEQRQLAEANLVDCEAELPDEPAPPPDGAPPGDEDARPPDEPSRPWFRDPAGGALAGAGLVGIVIGGSLMAVARRKAREAPNAGIEDDYLAISAQARRMNAGGIVVLSLGSALVIGGAIRYAVLAARGRRGSETAERARRRPAITTIGLGLGGSF